MATVTSCTTVQTVPRCEKAADLPSYCLALATLLTEQPLFTGKGSSSDKSKVISLRSYDDARICDIFSSNVNQIVGERNGWHIHEFGNGFNQLWDNNFNCLGKGLALWIYDDFEACSLEILEKSYHQVLEKFVMGWVSSKAEDYPDIMHKQDPNEFTLFIKESNLFEEDVLIRILAEKFSLLNEVKCGSDWIKQRNNKIYLWIRKNSFEKVSEKFGFKFNI